MTISSNLSSTRGPHEHRNSKVMMVPLLEPGQKPHRVAIADVIFTRTMPFQHGKERQKAMQFQIQ